MITTYIDYTTFIQRTRGDEISKIPKDENNGDYREFLNWLQEEGNTVVVLPVPGPSLDEVKSELKDQAEISLKAKLDFGFIFQSHRYPADVQAQTSMINQWDWYMDTDPKVESLLGFKSKDSGWIAMDEITFKEFKTAGRMFVMGLYQSIWDLKENLIVNALTVEEAQIALNNWETQ
jgi:hypothetical protein